MHSQWRIDNKILTMKKQYIYIPLVIILIIQIFDKEDIFYPVQILLLVITLLYAIIFSYKKNKEKN